MMDAEAVRAKWTDVMGMTPEHKPRWSDVLKASEFLAKSSGALHDGPMVVVEDAKSEEEMRAELMELLAMNPDVKHLITLAGKDVTDVEVISEVVGGLTVPEIEPGRPEPIRVEKDGKRGRKRKVIENEEHHKVRAGRPKSGEVSPG